MVVESGFLIEAGGSSLKKTFIGWSEKTAEGTWKRVDVPASDLKDVFKWFGVPHTAFKFLNYVDRLCEGVCTGILVKDGMVRIAMGEFAIEQRNGEYLLIKPDHEFRGRIQTNVYGRFPTLKQAVMSMKARPLTGRAPLEVIHS